MQNEASFCLQRGLFKKRLDKFPFHSPNIPLKWKYIQILMYGQIFSNPLLKYVRQLFNFLKFCRLFSWGIIKHFSLHIFTTSASFYLTFTSSKLKSDGITLPNSKSKLEEFFFRAVHRLSKNVFVGFYVSYGKHYRLCCPFQQDAFCNPPIYLLAKSFINNV